MSKLMIDGKPVGDITKFTLDFESYDPANPGKPCIMLGKQDISGSLTVYFEDAEALAEYCRRDVELQRNLRAALVKLRRRQTIERWIKRTLKITFVIALLLFATGAS